MRYRINVILFFWSTLLGMSVGDMPVGQLVDGLGFGGLNITFRYRSDMFGGGRNHHAWEGWRTVSQKDIDENHFSCSSVVILLRKDGKNLKIGVLVNDSTIMVPGDFNIHRKNRIWILGQVYRFNPVIPIDVIVTGKPIYSFIKFNSTNLIPPAKPADSYVATTLPPPNTKCHLFGFSRRTSFDLKGLGATVQTRSKCDEILGNFISSSEHASFCVELEILNRKIPNLALVPEDDEISPFQFRLGAMLLGKKEIPFLMPDRFPVFCQRWSMWRGQTKMGVSAGKGTYFAGFAIYQKMFDDKPFVFIEYFTG